MAHYCSSQERAIFDVFLKLRNAPLSSDDKEYIVEKLKKEGFIDESRFAKAFANDKFNLNHWGKIKIAYSLKMKRVDSQAIDEALEQIDQERYSQLVATLAKRKHGEIGADLSRTDRSNKVARFLLQRGFEPDLVWKTLRELP